MESEEEWTHYCEEPRSKQFVMCNLKNLKEIQTKKLHVPYDSLYLFDTVQIKDLIYFSGGGSPAAEGTPEQFYQIMMRVTIKGTDSIADKLANMNTARCNHAMISTCPTKLYVVGGENSTGTITSCEEYNVEANKWREIAPLNERKKWVTLCALANKLYTFGGAINQEAKATSTIEYLDTANPMVKAWEIIKLTAGKDIFKASFFVGAVPLAENTILLFGGVVNDSEKDDCMIFNNVKKTMEKHASILRPDAFYRTKYGLKKNNQFAIVGSHDGDMHVYDKTTHKWDLFLKKIWYPEFGLDFKANTF